MGTHHGPGSWSGLGQSPHLLALWSCKRGSYTEGCGGRVADRIGPAWGSCRFRPGDTPAADGSPASLAATQILCNCISVCLPENLRHRGLRMRARTGRGQAKAAAQQSQVAERARITRKQEALKKVSPTCRGWGGGAGPRPGGLSLLSCSWSVSRARLLSGSSQEGSAALSPPRGN